MPVCLPACLSIYLFIYISIDQFISGTVVGQITATDADEEGNENSIIAYSIVSQEPGEADTFAIDQTTGVITVKKPILDREVRPGDTASTGIDQCHVKTMSYRGGKSVSDQPMH